MITTAYQFKMLQQQIKNKDIKKSSHQTVRIVSFHVFFYLFRSGKTLCFLLLIPSNKTSPLIKLSLMTWELLWRKFQSNSSLKPLWIFSPINPSSKFPASEKSQVLGRKGSGPRKKGKKITKPNSVDKPKQLIQFQK